MPEKTRCANCDREIGRLEQAYLWENHEVCAECHARLSGDAEKEQVAEQAAPETAAPQEDVLWETHPAMFRSHPIWFVISVALILAYGLGAVILVIWFVQCLGTTLTVTTKRTVLRKGILSKRTTEIRHEDVRNLQTSQGVLQRLLGVGTLALSSAGQADIEIVVSGIAKPEQVADLVREHQ